MSIAAGYGDTHSLRWRIEELERQLAERDARIADMERDAKTLATANYDNACELQERIAELAAARAVPADAIADLVTAAKKAAQVMREWSVACDGDYDDAEELEQAIVSAERKAMYAKTIGTDLVAAAPKEPK